MPVPRPLIGRIVGRIPLDAGRIRNRNAELHLVAVLGLTDRADRSAVVKLDQRVVDLAGCAALVLVRAGNSRAARRTRRVLLRLALDRYIRARKARRGQLGENPETMLQYDHQRRCYDEGLE